MIGIYVKRDGQEKLAVESKGLSTVEDSVVASLHSALEQKLSYLRLPKEEWID